jgi:hypothetical protein
MKIIKKAFFCSAILPLLCNASSFDEDSRDDQSIPVGGALLTPIIKFHQRYDSNVASEKQDDVNSWLTIFQPSVKLTREFGEFGKHNFELDWIFTHGAYHASGDDSYNDHDVSGKLNYELNTRHRLMFQGGYIDAHEERGSRFSIGTGEQIAEPDTFEQLYGGIQYTYGAPTADARLELELGFLDNDYRSVYSLDSSNNPYDKTATRDRKTATIGGTFYYKIGSATDLTIEAWQSDYNYDYTSSPINELSSVESSAMIGAEWEATALTTGFAKIGYKNKDFDLSQRESYDDVEWEVEVLWEPKTYSKFTFSSGRKTEETNGEGFFNIETIGNGYVINHTQHEIHWQHEWKDRISSKVTYAISKDDYVGTTETGTTGKIREDNNKGVTASLYYDMSYWLSFSLDYVYNDRDSTRTFLDYDRELFTLGVRIALY